MSQELHHTLLSCGYRYTKASHLPESTLLHLRDSLKGYYVKDYITEVGVFPIALIMGDDPHINLPWAYLLQIPDQYLGKLIPHISHERILCYVEQMEADWNPNNLINTYRDVDVQIQLTLDNAVASAESSEPDDTELEGEFSAYWRPEEILYLLTKPTKRDTLVTYLSEPELHDGVVCREYVTVLNSKDNQLSNWLSKRGLSADSLKERVTTHYITIKPKRLAGLTWPPSNFGDVLAWLVDVDHNARNHVVQCLSASNKVQNIFLLDVERQDTIAIYIELNPKSICLQRYVNRKTRKASIPFLSKILGSKRANLKFKRLGVIKADRDTLLSRNLQRPGIGNLSEKRIALIGCGTIGGYLANLLVRSGAGWGAKHFHMYDSDVFKPHNFGRHVLTAHDFGRFKATALADSLKSSIHTSLNIKDITLQFPICPTALANYDIVIDATGRPPVSKRLASIIRTMRNERPTLIHAFNDGNGRASKILVDNGSSCYGCMVTNPATHRNSIDLRFEDIDQTSERHISCGGSYMPYDAAVSHITAALAQEAVLNTLESAMPWTYSEHMFDGSRSRKSRLLKRQLGCPICDVRY